MISRRIWVSPVADDGHNIVIGSNFRGGTGV